MKNNFPKMSLLFSIIFLAFSLSAFLFLYKEVDKNNKISQRVLTDWQAEANKQDQIKSLDRSMKMIEKEKVLLESHFAASSDIVPFLDTIEKLASQAGTKAEILSVDIAKDNPSLMVQMKTSGSFSSIYKFLELLENSSYELEFVLVDIKSTSAEDISVQKGVKIPQWEAVFGIKLLSFVQ